MNTKKTPSHTKVKCKFCSATVRQDRLKAHIGSQHKNELEKAEKNQSKLNFLPNYCKFPAPSKFPRLHSPPKPTPGSSSSSTQIPTQNVERVDAASERAVPTSPGAEITAQVVSISPAHEDSTEIEISSPSRSRQEPHQGELGIEDIDVGPVIVIEQSDELSTLDGVENVMPPENQTQGPIIAEELSTVVSAELPLVDQRSISIQPVHDALNNDTENRYAEGNIIIDVDGADVEVEVVQEQIRHGSSVHLDKELASTSTSAMIKDTNDNVKKLVQLFQGLSTGQKLGSTHQSRESEQSVSYSDAVKAGAHGVALREEMSAKKTLIKGCKSVSEIERYFPELSVDRGANKLGCTTCLGKGAGVGDFDYDFDDFGENFVGKKIQPRAFLNLKNHLCKHLDSNTHMKLTSAERKLEEEIIESMPRNYKIGMNLARIAYKTVKCGHSQLQFETDVATAAAEGVDVGRLNHSTQFVKSFTESVYKTLKAKMNSLIAQVIPATKRPTPIALLADKFTTIRRTHQIIGVTVFMDGRIQPLFSDMTPVKNHNGDGIAQAVLDGIAHFELQKEELRSRIVGGAFDGQYFNLGVPGHIMKDLDCENSTDQWYSFQWDPAHLIELAEGKKNSFVTKIQHTIRDINHKVGHGKGFETLLDEAESHNEAVAAPGGFSDTRFATYSHIVFKNFQKNYKNLYSIFKEDPVLGKINSAKFVLGMTGLMDIYENIGKISREVQQSDILPWDVQRLLDAHIETLTQMKAEFSLGPGDQPRQGSSLLPNCFEAYNTLKTSGEYNGMAILSRQLPTGRTTRTQSVEQSQAEEYEEAYKNVVLKLNDFIDKYTADLRRRIEQTRPNIIDTVNSLFDIDLIKSRKGGIPGENLMTLHGLAQATDNLDQNITPEMLEDEYRRFCGKIVPLRDTMYNKNQEVQQRDVYYQAFKDEKFYENLPNVMHLALTSMLRTHNEAVVESMGSIVNAHTDSRARLKPETLKNEIFLHWNGPNPAKAAEKLLEASLDTYFGERRKWNFLRSSDIDRLKFFTVSKVVDRINSEKPKIPF